MGALADPRVADYLNENFTSTYLKVGAFKKIGENKIGGNVATYFCLSNGAVLHAIAGPVDANKFLQEARWALDTRKMAQAKSVNLNTGKLDAGRFASVLRQAHGERYHHEQRTVGDRSGIPVTMPRLAGRTAQTHWLLASRPMAKLDTIYPILWRQILNEDLSALPVGN